MTDAADPFDVMLNTAIAGKGQPASPAPAPAAPRGATGPSAPAPAPAPAPGSPSSSGDIFDDMLNAAITTKGKAQVVSPTAPEQEPSTVTSALAQVGAGASKGAVVGLNPVAWGVDLASSALNIPARLVTGTTPFGGERTVGSSEWFAKHALPTPPVPKNDSERYLNKFAEGGTAMVGQAMFLPAAVEALVAKLGSKASPAVIQDIRNMLGEPGPMLGTIGGAANVGADVLAHSDYVPDALKPLAPFVGAAAFGAVPVFAQAGFEGARAAVAGRGGAMTPSGRDLIVGREMQQAAGSGAQQAYENMVRPDTGPLSDVPLSTAQKAQNMGLHAQAQSVRNENPAAFQAQEQAQQEALHAHLQGLQPTGDVEALPGILQQQRDAAAAAAAQSQQATEAAGAASVGRAAEAGATGEQTAAAQAAQATTQAEALHNDAITNLRNAGPDTSPTDLADHIRSVRSSIDALRAETEALAQRAAEAKRDAVASDVTRPEALAHLRDLAANKLKAAEDANNAIYDEIEKHGNVQVPSSRIAGTASKISSDLPEAAKQPKGEEKRILEHAAEYGPTMPFKEVRALRTAVMDLFARTDSSQVRGRMNVLRDAINEALDHMTEDKLAADANAVRRGTMDPADTTAAGIQRATEKAINERVQEAAADAQGVSRARARPGAADHLGEAGAAGEAGGQPGAPAGGAGLPERPGAEVAGAGEGAPAPRAVEPPAAAKPAEPPAAAKPAEPPAAAKAPEAPPEAPGKLTPEEVLDKWRQASAGYREIQDVKRSSGLGDILAKEPRGGKYKVSDAEVWENIFHPGDTGGERVKAFVDFVGKDDAHQALSDAAAYSFNKAAMRDGVVDPKLADKWLRDHATALRELPPEISERFNDAASAQQAVTEASAARVQRLKDFDASSIAKVAGLDKSQDIVAHVGSIIESKTASAQKLGELAWAAHGTPSAEAGLKSAIMEYLFNKFIPKEAGAQELGKVGDLLDEKREALARVFRQPGEFDTLRSRLEAAQQTQAAIGETKQAGEAAVKAAAAKTKETVAQAKQTAAEQAKAVADLNKEALSKYETGVLAKIMGKEGKDNILQTLHSIFKGPNSTNDIAALMNEAKNVEGGVDAVRKGITEMLTRYYTGTARSGVSETPELSRAGLAKFLKEKTDTLGQALTPDQIGRFRAIVELQHQINQTINAVKLKGGSDTTQKLLAAIKAGGGQSLFWRILMDASAGLIGHHLAGLEGAGIAGAAAEAVSRAGLAKLSDLRLQAALDPGIGAPLLRRALDTPVRNSVALLKLSLRRLGLATAEAGLRQQTPSP